MNKRIMHVSNLGGLSESRELYEKVIKGGYCIGCGICTGIKNTPFKIKMDKYGKYEAYPVKELDINDAKVLRICPFSDKSRNENEISDLYFPDVEKRDKYIGKYLNCFAGYVLEGRFRESGSSGGIGRWLGYTLLKEKMIDYFIQVVPNRVKAPSRKLFMYRIETKHENVLHGARSAYYPVTLSEILPLIKKNKGRYAITALPCFVKALRLLALEDDIFKERLVYTIGLICGGMKSANQAKMIGWQLGVKPENLVAIDFRRKYPDKPASFKIYQVWSDKDDDVRYRDSYDIFATDWGAGYFKPNACDYCDDVVNETADISIGDAWLPQFEKDPKGTSLLIVRNKRLLHLIEEYSRKKTLSLVKITAEDVRIAQAGGFRHRREGLSYRIAKKEKKNIWYPPKRTKANEYKLTRKRRRLYLLREKIAERSHISFIHALEKDDIKIFYKEMNMLVRRYHAINYGILPVRVVKKILRIIKSLKK